VTRGGQKPANLHDVKSDSKLMQITGPSSYTPGPGQYDAPLAGFTGMQKTMQSVKQMEKYGL